MAVDNVVFRDLRDGTLNFRSWITLSLDDLRARYARTIIGPFWLTLSQALFVVAFGFWSSVILQTPMEQQLLYLAAGLPVWALISTVVTDAPMTFVRSSSFILSYDLPTSIQVYRAVMGQLLAFGHTIMVLVATAVFIRHVPGPEIILALPGLAIVLVACVGLALGLSVVGLRYRDTGPLSGAILGALFVLTPVFWRRSDASGAPWVADYNPLFHLIQVVRGPLIGELPTLTNWVVAGVTAVLCVGIGIALFAAYRRQISYWI